MRSCTRAHGFVCNSELPCTGTGLVVSNAKNMEFHGWDMEFNPSKCQVIRVTSSRTPINTQYILHGQVLEAVSSARYLGVDISSDLSWNVHVDRVATTANKTLGFIRRNIKTKSPRVREMAYQSLVRPQLEYLLQCGTPILKNRPIKLKWSKEEQPVGP